MRVTGSLLLRKGSETRLTQAGLPVFLLKSLLAVPASLHVGYLEPARGFFCERCEGSPFLSLLRSGGLEPAQRLPGTSRLSGARISACHEMVP